uniref:Kinetochore protein NDC80 n=1 Tax=Strongyloides papillosus TaxID=174720 RepID=A0A0N5CFD1_STREA
MDQDNQSKKKSTSSENLSFDGKIEDNGNSFFTGRPSIFDNSTFNQTSVTDLSLFGRHSLINGNIQDTSTCSRTGYNPLSKETDENIAILKNFLQKQSIFPINCTTKRKKYNFTSTADLFECLKIIIGNIDKDYKCTNLQDDLNLFLTICDFPPLQKSAFIMNGINWKYIVDGFVKLIKTIDCYNDIFKKEIYNDSDYSIYFNDTTMHNILNKTIQSMGNSNDCKKEDYEELLKLHMENNGIEHSISDKDFENLKTEVENLRRNKKEYEDITKEYEKESFKLESLNKEIEILKNTITSNRNKRDRLEEELTEKKLLIKDKEKRNSEANKEWQIVKDKIQNQGLGEEEKSHLYENIAYTSNRIDVAENEIKQLKKEYDAMYDNTSEFLEKVDLKSQNFKKQLMKLNQKLGGNTIPVNVDSKYLGMSKNLDQILHSYKNDIPSEVENLTKEAHKQILLKEKTLSSLKTDIREMFNDYKDLSTINTNLNQ